MLKLTYSSCRFLRLKCENITKTYVKKITHWSSKRQNIKSTQCNLDIPLVDTRQQCRLLASIKKKIGFKKCSSKYITANESNTSKQMSESLQPTVDSVSYGGGQFEIISTDNSHPADKWKKQYEASGSGCKPKESMVIPPDFRVWESVGTSGSVVDGSSFKFVVVSYNVLAQYLLECHPYLYEGCVPQNLKWQTRAGKIYNEILSLAPDIICLQEVQASHLNSFYRQFEQVGYAGIFKQKTGHRHDGCAIYFKTSLFDLQDQLTVEFYQPQLPILNRDNIGLMVKLAPKNFSGNPLVVATTHLLFNPVRTDVRLAQMQVFLAEIDRFAFYDNGRESGHLPIILTGDFNSDPNSVVIKLLDRGFVSASTFRDSSDWQNIGVMDNCQHLSVFLNRQGAGPDSQLIKLQNQEYNQRPVSEWSVQGAQFCQMFNTGNVCHSLKLASAYNAVRPDGEHEATTFQDYWVTVDYIYFSCFSSLQLESRLRLPSANECEVLGRLPNDKYGSDHLILATMFSFKPLKSAL